MTDTRARQSPDYVQWARYGYEQGWVGPAVCVGHEGVPTSLEEEVLAENTGEYPCINILRLYPDKATKAAVEDNHSPSQWRALPRHDGRIGLAVI